MEDILQNGERRLLGGEDRLVPSENHLLRLLTKEGEVLDRLEARYLFPVHKTDGYITLLDEDGVERALIRALADLDSLSREAVEAGLADYYLVPKILRIVHASEKYGTLRWTVETDRGPRSFDIRNQNHDIRVQKDGSVRVRDADDNRYLIENYHDLDAHSRSCMISQL